MVEIHNINKTYGTVKALQDISFQVERGEIFGIIGADGAGKSTLFRILTTLLLADSGTATINGYDIVNDYKLIRQSVGYMPGRFSLYQDLTVKENLSFFATVFDTTIKANYSLIKEIYQQIEPFENRRAGNLSGGMKQKLALCCALIHRPLVLFLDEPTTGVDPVSRKEFWAILRKLKDENITILVSTPYMDEALLCDRIGLIRNGEFLKIESPQQIISDFKYDLLAISARDMPRLLRALRAMPEIVNCYAFGSVHHAILKHDILYAELYERLNNEKFLDIEIKQIVPTIEDCYMQLTIL